MKQTKISIPRNDREKNIERISYSEGYEKGCKDTKKKVCSLIDSISPKEYEE